jgi:hypothetical protein
LSSSSSSTTTTSAISTTTTTTTIITANTSDCLSGHFSTTNITNTSIDSSSVSVADEAFSSSSSTGDKQGVDTYDSSTLKPISKDSFLPKVFPPQRRILRSEKQEREDLELGLEAKRMYTPIPTLDLEKRSAISPSQLSQAFLDGSDRLRQMLQKRCNKEYSSSTSHATAYDWLLAEFQISFLSFFLGHEYTSFQHWKCLIQLLCSCNTAVEDNRLTSLFTGMIIPSASINFNMVMYQNLSN